jgi:hypothetical protein
MPDPNPTGSAMGDIIGSTRQRLEEPASPAERLKSLVAATTTAKPVMTSRATTFRKSGQKLESFRSANPSGDPHARFTSACACRRRSATALCSGAMNVTLACPMASSPCSILRKEQGKGPDHEIWRHLRRDTPTLYEGSGEGRLDPTAGGDEALAEALPGFVQSRAAQAFKLVPHGLAETLGNNVLVPPAAEVAYNR